MIQSMDNKKLVLYVLQFTYFITIGALLFFQFMFQQFTIYVPLLFIFAAVGCLLLGFAYRFLLAEERNSYFYYGLILLFVSLFM